MYRDRLTWASNEPSSIVVESINGTGVNELAADNDDLHILCDSLYEFDIVVSELPGLRRRRGRPPRPDPFAAGLDQLPIADAVMAAERAEQAAGAPAVTNAPPPAFDLADF